MRTIILIVGVMILKGLEEVAGSTVDDFPVEFSLLLCVGACIGLITDLKDMLRGD